jgi:hypothetical protein
VWTLQYAQTARYGQRLSQCYSPRQNLSLLSVRTHEEDPDRPKNFMPFFFFFFLTSSPYLICFSWKGSYCVGFYFKKIYEYFANIMERR